MRASHLSSSQPRVTTANKGITPYTGAGRDAWAPVDVYDDDSHSSLTGGVHGPPSYRLPAESRQQIPSTIDIEQSPADAMPTSVERTALDPVAHIPFGGDDSHVGVIIIFAAVDAHAHLLDSVLGDARIRFVILRNI